MSPVQTLAASLIGSAMLIVTSATAQNGTTGGRQLSIFLTGAAEPAGGDTDGSGTARVTVNPGQRQVCYTIEVAAIAAATGAHIHVGAAGTAPPNNIVVTLDPPSDGDSRGCATVSRALALQILKNPSNYYVNVHNAAYPAGALRGQLSK